MAPPKVPDGWEVETPQAIPEGWEVENPQEEAPRRQGEPAAFSPKSTGGTLLRSVAQGSSFGFSDELQGLVGKGIAGISDAAKASLKSGPGRAAVRAYLGDKAKDLPDSMLDALVDGATAQSLETVTGIKPGRGTPYEQARNEARRENEQAQAANPKTYFGGTIAGGVLVPGPKGLTKVGGAPLRPWVTRATQGIATGAATGAGMSSGDGDMLGDTLLGAGIGGVAAPVLGGAFDAGRGVLARWLEKFSRENALKAIGLGSGITNQAKQINYSKVDDLLELGAKVRDEGDIIKPFGTPSDVARRAEVALSESSDAKSAAIDELQQMLEAQGGKFDFNALAQKAEAALAPKEGWDPLTRPLAAKAMEMLGRASAAEGGFPMAEQVRRAAGKSINWKAPAMGSALPEEIAMQRKAYGAIADEIASQAKDVEAKALLAQGKVPTPEDLGASNQLGAMNRRISTLMDVNVLAGNEATRDVGRGAFGLKDFIAGGAVGGGLFAHGDPVVGAIAAPLIAAGSRVARDRLPSAMTYAAHAGSRTLPAIANVLEKPVLQSVAGPLQQQTGVFNDEEEKAIQAFQASGM